MSYLQQIPNFKPSLQTIKLLIVVASISLLFSGLGIYTGKIRSEAQIRNIELRFEHKDPLYMRQALSSCQVNLGDREAVRSCVQAYKSEMISPHKAKLRKQTIQGYLWWLFWGSVAVILYKKTAQKNSPAQIFSVFKTIFERRILNRIRSITDRFYK